MKPTQKQIAKIRSLWKQHRNIWEISQLTGLPTRAVEEIATADPSAISQAAAAMGRKGGASTSTAKKAAAQANGAKGGRPKKCNPGAKFKID
jgi:hypothetical protein